MRNIKACGPGCKRCKTTEETVKTAAAKRGVGGSLEKVTAPPRHRSGHRDECGIPARPKRAGSS